MPLEIREAQLADAPQVTRLVFDLGFEGGEAAVRRRLDRVLRTVGHVVFLAEEPPHGPVGLVHAAILPTLLGRPHCEIGAMVVAPDHRRGGVGKALMECVQDWALRRGVDDVVVQIAKVRQDAQDFYAGLGYLRAEERQIYTLDLAGPRETDDHTAA